MTNSRKSLTEGRVAEEAPRSPPPGLGPALPRNARLNRPLRIEVAGQTDCRPQTISQRGQLRDHGGVWLVRGGGRHGRGTLPAKSLRRWPSTRCQEFFAATADDPERTWPYKMDRGKGYEENRLSHGHQAMQSAHLRTGTAQRQAARHGHHSGGALRRRGRCGTLRTSAIAACTAFATVRWNRLTEDSLAAQRLQEDEAPHGGRDRQLPP